MKIAHTRAMIRAILNGSLAEVETQPDPVFGVGVPATCPGVPDEVLSPRNTWADKDAYDQKARDLAAPLQRELQEVRGGRLRRGARRRAAGARGRRLEGRIRFRTNGRRLHHRRIDEGVAV